MAELTASEVAALNSYKFMTVVGKRVIHPGGRASAEALLAAQQENLIAWYERWGYSRTGEKRQFPADPIHARPLRTGFTTLFSPKDYRALARSFFHQKPTRYTNIHRKVK